MLEIGKRGVIIVGALVIGMAACKPPQPGNSNLLGNQIISGDSRALREAMRLSYDEQVALVPALIETYNQGRLKQDVVGLLMEIGHPDAIDTFLSALEGNDVRLSSLAARGLGAVGTAEHVGAVANRIRTINDPNNYRPYLESLRDMPGDEASAEVVSGLVSRSAGSVGGIGTIRLGCTILGQSGSSSSDTIGAMIFGMVNFITDPAFEDATNDCVLGLVELGTPAIQPLLSIMSGTESENPDMAWVNELQTKIRTTMSQLGAPYEVASLRAARALADMNDNSVAPGLIQWFSVPHSMDAGELSQMFQAETATGLDQATEWHMRFGELFTNVIEALGSVASPGTEDPAHQALRGLLQMGDGRRVNTLLDNFRDFMGTGGSAELGLRSEVFRALASVGDPEDRQYFLDTATEGTLGRASDRFVRKEAAYYFAVLSRAGDLDRYDELIQETEGNWLLGHLNEYRPMLEMAEACGDQISCLSENLSNENSFVRAKAAFDLAHFVENETAAASTLLDALDAAEYSDRFVFLRQLRQLTFPQSATDQITRIIDSIEVSGSRQFEAIAYRHQLRILRASHSSS
jgi:HEAT repeat protein